MRARSGFTWAATICGVAVLVAGWLTLWPIGLGGSTGYAIVIGTSMEPRLHRGDVVVVRQSGEYHVGEVVAYRSRTLRRTVLHRIIAVHDGRYVFRGDANNFTDPGEVRRSDLIGGYWFKIGGAAPAVEWVQRPWHAALIAGVLALFLFGSSVGQAPARRRRRRREEAAREPPPHPALEPRLLARAWAPAAAVAAIGLTAFAALGVVAYGLPATRQTPTDRLYSQAGNFSYSGPAQAGPAYPTGRVAPGEAVFTQLVHRLDVRFDWRFDTAQPHLVHGAASLVADISDGAGWSRRIVLAPRRPFAGDRLALAGTLHVDALERMLRRLEATTGVRNGIYQLRLEPNVRFSGVVAGTPVADGFAPPLQLSLDELRMQVTPSTDPAQPNGLARSKDAGGLVTQPNRIRFAGQQLALVPAKRAGWLGGAVSLLALCLALLARGWLRPKDEAARLRARYGGWIVRVTEASPASRFVDLTEFADLARIAERYDRLILQDDSSGHFLVEEESVSYRWRPAVVAHADALARIADVVERKAEQPAVGERRDLGTRAWATRSPEPGGDERPASSAPGP